MRYLINGVCGGIGSTLGYYLYKEGHEIIGLDNLSNGYRENLWVNDEEFCEFHRGNADKDTVSWILNNYKIDAVVHLSAISSLPECEAQPVKCLNNNVTSVLETLEECRRYKIKKFVFASSSAVYENNNESVLTEDLTVRPVLAYPLSKKLAEDICLSYIEKYDMDISVLRFFNVINDKSDYKRLSPPLINYIVKEIKAGKQPNLHSDGKQARDYISVDKVCEAINACLSQKATGIFNICSGQTISVAKIYEIVSKTLAFNKPPIYNNSENLWKDYNLTIKKEIIAKEVNKYALGSNKKIEKILGVDLSEDTEEMIKKTTLEIAKIYAS